MSTCGKPVDVLYGETTLTRPCDKAPGHEARCAAWFRFGMEADGDAAHQPGPLDLVNRHPGIPVRTPVRGKLT